MSSTASRWLGRLVVVVIAAHASSAPCVPQNTSGCPTVECGPDHRPNTVCYPGACANLLGKCNFDHHGIQYYCCPTEPAPTFECVDSQCVQRLGGINKRLCEQACVPPVSAAPTPTLPAPSEPNFVSINAITLATTDMRAAYDFYSGLGLNCTYGCTSGANWTTFGGPDRDLSSFHINLYPKPEAHDLVPRQGWGRVVFYVTDVDAVYALLLKNGLRPEFAPRDADWGERYFHILDPSGHELAIAAPLRP
jgi:catechol 2,3-dioxygenase-like lactoylglutathione lyase family enzyme